MQKITLICLGLLLAITSFAQTPEQKITLNVSNISLQDFFKQIEQQSSYTVVYRDVILDNKKDVTVNVTNKNLSDLLTEVLGTKNLSYQFSNKTIVLVKKDSASKASQAGLNRSISGIVVDNEGEPLIGVSVAVKGVNTGTVTDIDGRFSINAPEKSDLIFSYVGYNNKSIVVSSDQKDLNIVLDENIEMLEEVVVIGYGSVKKKDLTGSLSSIDTKKLQETHKTSVGGALQGQVAGVDIVKANNKPGAGYNFMIRGQSTIKTEPGGDSRSEMNNINPPLYVVDGMFVGSISDIAPDDIERIDILKDASSTAIYGSRGANGVVIVSTKRGAEDKSYVEFNTSLTIGQATNLPDFLDADGYVQYRIDRDKGMKRDQANYTPDLEKILSSQQYNNYTNGKTIDWEDEVLENSVSYNGSARVYGNSKGTAYTFGLSYNNEDGIIGMDGYERYNLSTSIDKQLNKAFRAGVNLYTAYELTQNSGTETFRTIYRLNPLTDKYNEDGSLRLYPDATISNLTNPFLEMENLVTERKSLHAFGNVFLEYKPTSWMRFTTTLTPDISFSRYGEYRGKDTKSSKGNQAATRAIYDTNNTLKYTWDNILYAEQKFKDNFINLTLGTSWYKSNYEQAHVRADAFPVDDYQWYNLGTGTMKEMTSNYVQEQLMAYFGRLNYDYKSKYLLTVTGRYDGSSKLAEGHQWKFFPSAAVAWRVTEESFMKNVKAINDLKIRLSYGVSGNNGVASYTSAQKVLNDKYLFGNTGVTSAYLSSFENETLTWETTKEFNLGIDLSLLKGRVNLTVDVYNRNISDIIMNRSMSELNGFSTLVDNVGKSNNKGIEVALNTTNIRTKDFTWSTNINFSTNRNKITALNDGNTEDKINGWFVGEAVGSVFTYKHLGFWQESEEAEAKKIGLAPGSIKIADDGDGAITNDDKVIIGSLYPDWMGGITNTFKFKDVDFSFFINTRQGQYSYSQFHRGFTMNDDVSFNVIKLNYWTPENPTGTWNRPGVPVGQADVLLYTKTSYTKIGYINLGYTFPAKMLKKMGISKLRLYTSCQNPYIWTDYAGWDPETASENTYTQYAMIRSFIFGLNLTF